MAIDSKQQKELKKKVLMDLTSKGYETGPNSAFSIATDILVKVLAPHIIPEEN